MNEQLKQMLHVQWKASRWPMLPFALLCVGLPIMAVGMSLARARDFGIEATYRAGYMIGALTDWAGLFAVLAALLGATAALTSWQLDHRMHHIYSLSLPVSRARYTLLKYIAGLSVVAVCALLVLIGSIVATTAYPIPDALTAYPFAFSFRFFFGALLGFSVLFAMAAGTIRTTVWIVAGFVILVVFGQVWSDVVYSTFDVRVRGPGEFLYDALTTWPGPFHVFGGNWMLVDV